MRKKIVNPKKLLLLDFIIIYSWCNFFEKVYILAKMSQKRTILAKLTILATPMCVTSHNTKNAWGTGWLSKKKSNFWGSKFPQTAQNRHFGFPNVMYDTSNNNKIAIEIQW